MDRLEGAAPVEVRTRLAVDGGLLLAGLVAGQLFSKIDPPAGPYAGWSYSQLLPVAEWGGAVASFARGVAWAAGRWPAFVVAAAAAGVALLLLPTLRPHLRGALLRAAALAVTAVAYAAGIALLRWVGENAWHPRYFAPSAVLLQVAAVGLLAEALSRLPAVARPAALLALALVPLAALASWGAPSLRAVREDLARVAGARTEAILAARCDLVAGDYWTVWPSTWHANAVLAERGEERRIWGIAHRCSPTAPQWRALPREGLRICVAHGEEKKAERWLGQCGAGATRVAEPGKAVDVWVPVVPAATRAVNCRPTSAQRCSAEGCEAADEGLHAELFDLDAAVGTVGACLYTDCFAGAARIVRDPEHPWRVTGFGSVRSSRPEGGVPPPGSDPFPLTVTVDLRTGRFTAIWSLTPEGHQVDFGSCELR